MPIQPRNILITGAGSGLGRGLSVIFAQAGHRLYLADRDAAGLEATRAVLTKSVDVSLHTFDITSSADVDRAIASLAGTGVDVLINNAGVQHVAPIEQMPEEKYDWLFDVMVKGPFLMTKAVLPMMRQRKFGRIVHIGSIHSLVASPFKATYVAAKHALLGLSKGVALETGADDITINTICPAYIRTPLVDKQIKAQAATNGITEEEVTQKIFLDPMPKKAFITFEEIAAAISFLMTREARNITGQTITIDGGWTAR